MADNNNTQHIVWHDDAIIKQLISYAVGCMLGRYRASTSRDFTLPTLTQLMRRLPLTNTTVSNGK